MRVKSYKLFLEKKDDIIKYLQDDETQLKYIWDEMYDFLTPDFNHGEVKFIFDEVETERDKLKIPKMYIEFLLRDDTGVDMESLKGGSGHMIMMQRGQCGPRAIKFDILKHHPCYAELMKAHKHTLDMMGIDEKDSQLLAIKASNDPWTSDTRSETAIYCEVHYELVNSYLNYVYDRIRNGDPYNFAGNYLKLFKGKVNDDNEIIKLLKKLENRRKDQSDFNDVFRKLYSYGFEYEHIIDAAKNLDLSKFINSGLPSREIFYVMCITGNFTQLEYLEEWDIDFFFYSSSNKGINLGLEALRPAFKRCMRSELLWVEGESEEMKLALLFLIFEPNLLKSHTERGTERDYWLEIVNEPFNDVVESLIAYNRKESMTWLIDLFKSGDVGDLERFIGDMSLYIRRLKTSISEADQRYKKIGKPDFEFFESKVKEIKDWVNEN